MVGDISYNSLSITSQGSASCSQKNKNLCTNECLGGHACSKMFHNLHINCGGKEVTINGSRYEDDSHAGGSARFIWNRLMMLERQIFNIKQLFTLYRKC